MTRFKIFALLVLVSGGARAADFYLKNGDRVVFYGDSITDQRLYTTFAETYVVTRFPRMNVTFVHSGWGGDRVTGGGGGPVDLRLERDVIAYDPTVMTIMLGMNDGSYRAFDQKIFETYTSGYQHIVDAVKKARPNIRITVIVPSPFDDVTRPPQFEGGYNGVLLRYGQFVRELAGREHLQVADLNTPVTADLEKAKSLDASLAQKLLPDRVHPGPAGHLFMAEALLKAWNAPAIVTSVEIDAAQHKVVQHDNANVSGLASNGLAWEQEDEALPFPIDQKDAAMALAVKSSDVLDALDRESLKVTGLNGSAYTLKIDGVEIGNFGKDDFARGINLAAYATPMTKQAAEVHALTLKHNNIHFSRWRSVQVPLQDDNTASKRAAMAALDKLDDDLVHEQRAAAQPKVHHYELVAR